MTRTTTSTGRAARRVLVGMLATVVVATGLSALGASGAGAAVAGSISGGNVHTCAVMADTSARCWGQNFSGQLGSMTGQTFVPVPVTSTTGAVITGITQIAAGGSHTCARFSNGTARCWGANDAGQLGDGTATGRPHPVFVRKQDNTPLTGVVSIVAGFSHTCAVLTDGTARCWGQNSGGQVGDGSNTFRTKPVPVTSSSGAVLTGVTSLAAGGFHTCARLSSGQARCWGNNSNYQIGDATAIPRNRAAVVLNTDSTPLGGIAEVTAGDVHSCARFTNGTVRCWGWNLYGQLGDGSNTDRPAPVFVRPTASTVLTGVVAVSASGFHTCARLSTGQARCWGINSTGQLGDGTTTNRNRPVAASSVGGAALTGATQVAAGNSHTCARLSTGQMRCWGGNSGQLGDGTNSNQLRAVPVVGGSLTGVA